MFNLAFLKLQRRVLALALLFGTLFAVGLGTNIANAVNYCTPSSITTSGSYTIVKFNTTGTCNWQVPAGVTVVDADVVAGGGSGGMGIFGGGGGGGGQVVQLRQQPVTAGQSTQLTVGAGGAAIVYASAATAGKDGGDSKVFGFTAKGGRGGGISPSGSLGGPGGASYSASVITAGSGTVSTTVIAGGVGNTVSSVVNCTVGRNGGGGASSVSAGLPGDTASTSGNGANGYSTDTITGLTYGGGGGGHRETAGSTGVATGGSGGGGNGGRGNTTAAGYITPTAGTANTGSGGGGNGGQCNVSNPAVGATSGAGGSGTVVLRYVTPAGGATNGECAPYATTYKAGYKMVSFKTPGTCNYTVPAGVTSIDYELVGGGGGGGASNAAAGGGGGGQYVGVTGKAVTGGQQLPVVIGAGGNGATFSAAGNSFNGFDGAATTFDGKTAAGGKGGFGGTGGTLGTGGASFTKTTITSSGTVLNTSFAGGTAGSQSVAAYGGCALTRIGGGGAGTATAGSSYNDATVANRGKGGNGFTSTISGFSYGGGGGGAIEGGATYPTPTPGGTGGGGSGSWGTSPFSNSIAAADGTDGLGGGGGGTGGQCGVSGWPVTNDAGRGGDGGVLIKYWVGVDLSSPRAVGYQAKNAVTWTLSPDLAVTGYRIAWAATSAALSDANIATVPVGNTATVTGITKDAYEHKNLPVPATYFYRIAPLYTSQTAVANTQGNWSSIVTATTQFTVTTNFSVLPVRDVSGTRVATQAAQDFTVPQNVSDLQFDMKGAAGGLPWSSNWGNGGAVAGNLPVTAGELLKIFVGWQPKSYDGSTVVAGWNGGGRNTNPSYNTVASYFGGDATDIRRGGAALANRILVAGGGGGYSGGGNYGGPGAGPISNADNSGTVAGGTQTGPGAQIGTTTVNYGSLGQGADTSAGYAGAGGGGYYGGNASLSVTTAGGGGGSSYAVPGTPNLTFTNGTNGGDGSVSLTYAASSQVVTGVQVVPGQFQNTVTWAAPNFSGLTGYKVYGGTSPNPTTLLTTITSPTTLAYTQSMLTNGTTYYYRVTAYVNAVTNVNPTLETAYSAEVSATPRIAKQVTFNVIPGTANQTPQQWTVPAGVTWITVDASGAAGGLPNASVWGLGGRVRASIPVTPGETLNMYVGWQPKAFGNTAVVPGWNGGGRNTNGSYTNTASYYGGDATDIRRGGTALSNRILVAGGGGGYSGSGSYGGAGGGLDSGNDNTGKIAGGTQTGPGAAPTATAAQTYGTLGVGANTSSGYAGAGGGGYYGGNASSSLTTAGGGGGSSYTIPAAVNVIHNSGYQNSDGSITITYLAPDQVVTGVQAIPGQYQNTITWNPTDYPNSNGYKIYGGTTPNPTTSIGIAAANAKFFVHSGLTNGTTYYYRVVATFAAVTNVNTAYETSPSAEVSAVPSFLASKTFDILPSTSTQTPQPWVVPPGVTWIYVDVNGAAGGLPWSTKWGRGARVQGYIPVTPGETLNMYVGWKPKAYNGVSVVPGWNGGGRNTNVSYNTVPSYFGGDASDIRRGGTALANRVVVAGGGGGYSGGGNYGGPGGALDAGLDNSGSVAGGTQTGPGVPPAVANLQTLGTLGQGANTSAGYAGAGGGGYWGGNASSSTNTWGGGGGSSYTDPAAVNVVHTQGLNGDDGSITITWATVAYPTGVVAMPGQGFNTVSWTPTEISGATAYKVYGGTTPNPTTVVAASVSLATPYYKHTGLTIGTKYYYRVAVMVGTAESQKSAEVSSTPAFTVDVNYSVTRNVQTFKVPSGVNYIYVDATGAAAGMPYSTTWGQGGRVQAVLPVTPGETLNLYVGWKPKAYNGVSVVPGWNGGGKNTNVSYNTNPNYFGGDATDIRRGTSLASRILVAGGGGGYSGSGSYGGPGGCLICGLDNGGGVYGGSQTGPGPISGTNAVNYGQLGLGADTSSGYAGAGGGGYWGGNSSSANTTFGGGGGSSYALPAAFNVIATPGYQSDDGSVKITYVLNEPVDNFAAVAATSKVTLSWSPSLATGLASYQVYRGTTPNPTTLLTTVPATSNTYTDSTAVNGTTYYYRVVTMVTVNAATVAASTTADTIATPAASTTVTFSATRAPQAWVVPAGVSFISVTADGAAGGLPWSTKWGRGGRVTANLPVTPGETLYMYVGSQPKTVSGSVQAGWNGGGRNTNVSYTSTASYYGGDATDIRRGGQLLANRILVAGGGGGYSGGGNYGGPGGGLDAGLDNSGTISGGTQTGPGLQVGTNTQNLGTLGVGANTSSGYAGAGGGGYWGGNSSSSLTTSGGGGGSSWTYQFATSVVHSAGVNGADGSISISYILDTVAPTVSGVTSPQANGVYKAGTDVYVDINFTEPVVVTGSPTLLLNAGTRTAELSYVDGSQTTSLRFLYTVLPGDNTTALDIAAGAALKVNGGTIKDFAGNFASTTTPAPGANGSLVKTKTLIVDGGVPAAPTMLAASGTNSINLAWTANTESDLKTYRIYVSSDLTNFAQLNSVDAPLTTFTQQVVARGITYYYYITAVDINGNESGPSSIVSWTLPVPGQATTPSVLFESPTSVLRPAITGVADPGATVSIYDGGTLVGTAIADALTGAYSVTPSADLSIGTHQITAVGTLGILSSAASISRPLVIDRTAPTFTSLLRLDPTTERTAANTLTWRLTFSEEMLGIDPSDFTVTGTTATVQTIAQVPGSPNIYDVRIGGNDIGTVNGQVSLSLVSGLILTDKAGNALASLLPTAPVQTYTLDRTQPTATLTSNKAAVGAGGTAVVTVTLSAPSTDFTGDDISVTGGSFGTWSGSGTTYTAVFTPTVGFQGNATIDSPAGLWTSTSGSANGAATQLTIAVDTQAPTVSYVSSSSAAGTYGVGSTVNVVVNFSEAVTVTGVPQLKLETGTVDRVINYTSGSGTSALTFAYTVQTGDTSADLNYFDTASLTLNTGSNLATLKDAAANNATLTLPATSDATNSLAARAAIVLDTTAPTAPTSLATWVVTGGTVVANAINSTNTKLTASATVTAGDATGGRAELIWKGVVIATDSSIAAGDTTVTFDTATTTAAGLQALFGAGVEGADTWQLKLYDAAGNISTGTLATTRTYDVTSPQPTITITAGTGSGGALITGTTTSVSITTGETPTGWTIASATATNGALSMMIGVGSSYSMTLTPTANTEGSASVAVGAGAYTDLSGNPNLAAVTKSILIDTKTPAVSSVSAVTANGSYGIGQSIQVRVVFGEIVNVTGTPQIGLNLGTTKQATYVSGSGSTTLIFGYTTVAGDTTADLAYASTSALALNAGTIKDAAGNNATLTLPAVSATGSLDANAAISVDGVAPTAPTALTATPVGGTVRAGFLNGTNTNLTATATVTAGDATGGRAELYFGTTLLATDSVIASGDTSVTFDLGLANNAALQAAIAASGSLTVKLFDAAGNNATSTAATLTVDYVKPTVTLTAASFSGALKSGDTLRIDVTASDSNNAINVGSNFTVVGGSYGSTFTTTTAGTSYYANFVPNIDGAWSVAFQAGKFTDAAGNSNTASNTVSGTADTVAPAVTSVTGLSANGTYKAGDSIDIVVNFGEAVTVTGTPTLSLAAGTTRNATYQSGSATGNLTFRYVVQSGDSAADLTYTASTALSLNAGTIKDAAGNNAVLTLPAPTAAGSLAANAAIVVDAVAPIAPTGLAFTAVGGTVRAGYLNGTNTNVTASANITANDVTGGRAELLFNGTVIATDSSISSTDTSVTFDLGTNSTTALQGAITASGSLTVRLVDPIGNNSSSPSSTAVTVDFVKPTTSISGPSALIKAGGTASISITTSEVTSDLVTGDLLASGGSLAALGTPSASGNGQVRAIVMTPTVEGTYSLEVPADSYTDAAGNPNTGATFAGSADTISPVIQSISQITTNGAYGLGTTLQFKVNFSENVTIGNGTTPTLPLALGTTKQAAYVSGSGAKSLVFSYTVAAGDSSSDLTTPTATPLAIGSATIQDAAGNDATLTLPVAGSAGNLATSADIIVDGVAPSAPSAPTFTIAGLSQVANTLNSTSTNLTISASVTAGDATGGYAQFLLGSTVLGTDTNIAAGDTSVSFTVLAGGNATAANLQAAIPTGGVVTVKLFDAAGNSVTSSGSNLAVDYVLPLLIMTMLGSTVTNGQTRTISFNTGKSTTTFVVGDVTASVGSLGSFSGSGNTYTAVWTPPTNAQGSVTISVAAGAYTDAAGNPGSNAVSQTLLYDTKPPTVTLTATAATASANNITFTLTGDESIDCSTLALTNGVDFDFTNVSMINSIIQTSPTVCTINVTANATRGSPKSASLAKAASFEIADSNGNLATALTVTSATTLVTIPSIAPTAPQNVSGLVGDASVTLSWLAPLNNGGSPISEYIVEYSSDNWATSQTWNNSANPTATSVVITGLTNGTTYAFRVCAKSTANLTSPTSSISGLAPFGLPSAPTNLQAVAGDSQITISFGASNGNGKPITRYEYSLNDGANWSPFSNLNTSQTIVGVINGNPYPLRVRAVSDGGNGAEAILGQTVTPNGAPSAPTINAIVPDNQSLTVAFNAPTSTGGSTISNYEYRVDGGNWIALSPASTTSPFTITGLTNGQAYSIELRAVNASSFASPASTAFVGTPMAAPGTPTAVSAASGNGSLVVSFTPGDTGGANVSYTVSARPTSGGSGSQFAVGNGSPITVAGLTNGVQYDITVTATNIIGSSSASTAITAYPGARPAPAQITSVVAGPDQQNAGMGQLQVAFNAVSLGSPITAWQYEIRENATACQGVYDPTAGGNSWSAQQNFNGSGGTLTVGNLTLGSCYEVQIVLTNALGVSDPSRASGMPVSAPSAVTQVVLTPDNGQLTVGFMPPADNGGLAITAYEYSTDSGTSWRAFSNLDTTQVITVDSTNTALVNGTIYVVTVRAINSAGAGATSSAAAEAPRTIPTLPSGSLVSGDGSVSFELNAAPNSSAAINGGSSITSYQYSLDGGTTWKTALWTDPNTTVTIPALSNGHSYGVRVRAVNAAGFGPATTQATVDAGTAPLAPNLNGLPGRSSITVTVQSNGDGGYPIQGYRWRVAGINNSQWTAVANPTFTVNNLVNGTPYTVDVVAYNSKGDSAVVSYTGTPVGVPGAPNMTATAGINQVVLQYNPPADNGGSPVINYQYTIDNGTSWTTVVGNLARASANNSSTLTISNLTNGVSYDVGLRAVNGVGAGTPNIASITPTASAPDAPTIGSITAGRGQLTVNFTPGASDGGSTVVAYDYELNGSGNFVRSTWTSGNSLTITGLTNGTSYAIRIHAVNAAGASNPSNSVTSTPDGTSAALAIVSAYDGTNQLPILADYVDAGVTGVTSTNIAAINSIIAALPATATDSTAELQAIVNAYLKVVALADGVDNNAVPIASGASNPGLSSAEWALLGVTVSGAQVDLLNDVTDSLALTSLDTAAELQNIGAIVARVMTVAAGGSASPALTDADFTALGISNVTSASLGVLLNLIDQTANDGSGVDSLAELQALANTAQASAAMSAALSTIQNYNGTNTAPTIVDFTAAGVTGVDATNLAAILDLLKTLPASARDTTAELQAIVDALNKLKAAADGLSSVPGNLVAADFNALGLTTIDTAPERSLFNAVIAGRGFANLDTVAEQSAMAAIVSKVIATAAVPTSATPSPALTVADFAALGISGVTSSNIAAVIAAIEASANDGTGVDTRIELQALVDAAAATANALNAIANYTGSNTAPTANDYAAANVTGVDAGNLALINEFIAVLPSSATDSTAEIQAIVDAVNHIRQDANGAAEGGSYVTVSDLTALGYSSIATANEAALFNSVIDSLAFTAVDTVAELNALVSIVDRIATAAAGGTASPALTAADFAAIGVTGVNSTNIATFAAQIAATADDASGVNSVAKLQALVSAANAALAQTQALATISQYDGTNTAPSASDYTTAGVTGVTGSNLTGLNSIIASLPASATDSAAELQAIVDAYNKLLALADATDNNGTGLTQAEYALLGMTALDSAAKVALANDIADVLIATSVDSAAELTAIATAAGKVIATAAATSLFGAPNPALSVADFTALGITGVTSGNLATVIANIIATANDGSAVDTLAELQALVNASALQALQDAAAALIAQYDGTNTVPVTADYLSAGVVGVSPSNIAAVNAMVGPLAASETDTRAELQAIVDAVSALQLAANSAADASAHLTAANLAALGAAGVDTANEVALFNSIVDQLPYTAVDTPAEIAAIARIVEAIQLIAAGGNANPALTPADFALIGITNVDSTNLAGVIAQIAATPDNGSGAAALADLNNMANLAAAAAAAAAALDVISAYDGTNTAPTSADYATAGITGVTGLNLAAINAYVAALSSAATDTAPEVQAVVDAYAALIALADGQANSGTALNSAQYAALGATSLDTAAELALANSLLDSMSSAAVASPANLLAAATAVSKVMATAAATSAQNAPVPALTPADFAAMGITGVDSTNIDMVIQLLIAAANDGSSVNTAAKLQTLVDNAALLAVQAAAAALIANYDGTNTAPVALDYSTAGVAGVTLNNLAAVNAMVGPLAASVTDSTAELQAIVDAVNKLQTLADGQASVQALSTSAITAADTAALGIAQLTTTAQLALLNNIVDTASFSAVDSQPELAAIATVIGKLTTTAAGGTANPALTPADFALLGVTGVDSTNIAALIAQIAATADNGSGIDSLTKLQNLVTAANAAVAAANALAIISAYDGTNTVPTLADYNAAGITGVNSGNLAALNSFIATASVAETDTAAEVQAIASSAAALVALADGTVNSGTGITLNDIANLGANTFTGSLATAKLGLLNGVLDGSPVAAIDSVAELNALIAVVNRVMATAAGLPVAPALSIADFAALNITGVNAGNLATVVATIAATPNDGSAVDTFAELSALAATAVADVAAYPAIDVIVQYADDSTKPAPTFADYQALGITGISAGDVVWLNELIAAHVGTEVNTSAKIQALGNAAVSAMAAIQAYAASPTTAPAPTLADYTTLGITGLDQSTLEKMNTAVGVAGTAGTDTLAKLQALANQVNFVPPPAIAPVTKLWVDTTASIPTLKWAGGVGDLKVTIISSTGTSTTTTVPATALSTALTGLEPGLAYAITVVPVGSTNIGDVVTAAVAIAPNAPTKVAATPLNTKQVRVTWSASGAYKVFKVTVAPTGGSAVTFTTGDSNLKIDAKPGTNYKISIVALGEGETESQTTVLDYNFGATITSVVVEPVAKKAKSLIRWVPLLVKPGATYLVRVDGKLVCKTFLTSCEVKRILGARNKVTVSMPGVTAAEALIPDANLHFNGSLGFVPNTSKLDAGQSQALAAIAKSLKAKGVTKIVVTGHANPVVGVALSVSTRLAQQRAIVIVNQLRKLLPGVQIVAVNRSVFSPFNGVASQSVSNIRAEIYATK